MCSNPHSSPNEDHEAILELRNTLTIMIGRAQLLQRRLRNQHQIPDSKLQSTLEIMVKQGFRAKELLRSIEQEDKKRNPM